MRYFNAKARITIGLIGLMISLTMLASFMNLIPDQYAADIERRTVLSETIAVYSTAVVKTARTQRLRDDFELMASRNEDLLSLALRRKNGNLLVATADHTEHWQDMFGKYSTSTQVQVPILAGETRWGQLELRFNPMVAGGVQGIFDRPLVQLVLFLGVCGFLVYYFYLGKVLRQLDPSQAVPGRVRSALDTMAEGLLILDRKEQIVLANQAFSSMVGKAADELIGFRAGELPWIDAEDKPVAREKRPWVDALLAGKIQKDNNIRLKLSDLSTRTFKTNCSPVLGDKDKYAGVLVSFDDITELEQKEIELLNSKLEAEEANKAKSSFLATMSHEIRTPMNAILGFTEILKRGYVKNEEESLKYLNTIHSSGKNLLELINDILDLSKVESGHLEVEQLSVEPYSTISEVVEMLKVKAEDKGLLLSFKVDSKVPAKITTDPVRLRQIAFNLIGNSIKFTEQGRVEVSCRYQKTDSESLLCIDISDTGIGMDETAQKNVFNPFVQADSSVNRRFGGTGLGLAISQKFTRALGGDISVKSELGKGSVFTVSVATGDLQGIDFLSPEQVIQLQSEQSTADSSSWQLPASRVLVVDDGAENRELVSLLLTEAGVQVEQAENGQVGVDMATASEYDVILMDVNMPVMDGFTAAGIIREQNKQIPIIALTANAMVGFENDCLEAGYSGYLSKPINIDQFMEMMIGLLGGQKLDAAELQVVSETTSDEFADNSPLISTLPADNEKFQKIISRFVSRLQEQLAALSGAAKASEFAEVENLAHWLKGAGGTVGFAAFTEPAAQLEEWAKQQQQDQVDKLIAEITELATRIQLSGDSADVLSHKGPETVAKPTADVPDVIVSRLVDNQRLHRAIGLFVDTLHKKIELMEQALATKNFADLALQAHWLKGSAGTVGFDVFTQPAIDLEKFSKEERLEYSQNSVRMIKRMSLAIVAPERLSEERG